MTTPDSVKLGYYANQDSSRALFKAYLKRHWLGLPEGRKKSKKYSIFHTYDSRIYSFAGLRALAKWFYPEEFGDVDPEAGIKEFHERFMPIDYSGTWMVDLK